MSSEKVSIPLLFILICNVSFPCSLLLQSLTSLPLACSVDLVTLDTALEIFNEHELQPSDRVMDVVEVIHCLTALYERLEEERGILVNVPLCVDMSLNWLLNVFDRYLLPASLTPFKAIKLALLEPAHCLGTAWRGTSLLELGWVQPGQCCKEAHAAMGWGPAGIGRALLGRSWHCSGPAGIAGRKLMLLNSQQALTGLC